MNQIIGNIQESRVMYRAIIRWRNETFIWSMFERVDWFIMLAHANYVYIQSAPVTPLFPIPTVPPPMIPVPGLLLGAEEANANHVYIQPASLTLGEFQTIISTFLANQQTMSISLENAPVSHT